MSSADLPQASSVDESQQLVAQQIAAVRESGWGSEFRLIQPRNLAFWVYWALVVAGAFLIVRYVGSATEVYGSAITLAVIVFAIYGAVFWWFTQHIDRYAHQSRKLILLAFLWGSFGAIVMASSANTPILSLWSKAFGASWASDWGAGLTAPVTEELSKGLGLLLLIALSRRAVATAFDGFILGAFIGLGFQIVEDITYAIGSAGQGFGASPGRQEIQTIALRMIFGIGSHIAFTAIFCTGLVHLLGRPGQRRRVGVGLALILTAMVLHGLWDDLGGIVGAAVVLLIAGWVVMIALILFIVVRIYVATVPPERSYMLKIIAPEVAAGVITEEEASTLAGGRKARRAYRKVDGDRAQRRYLLQAAHDLANELAAAGAHETYRVQYARQEIARIRAS